MKQNTLRPAILIGGLLLIAAGIYLLLTAKDPQGMMLGLPYVCIGVGSGLFGQGAGSLINAGRIKRNPQIARAAQIERNDERNIALINRAKAKAMDIMIYTFGALILAFVLIGASVPVVILMVAAILVCHRLRAILCDSLSQGNVGHPALQTAAARSRREIKCKNKTNTPLLFSTFR